MNRKTPFFIISYFTFSDKNSIVGGLRPFYIYKKLLEKGWDVKLITPYNNDGIGVSIKEGFFIKLIKPLLRVLPPDSSIAWSFKVFLYLKRINKNEHFIVFTTAPPHGIGLTGLFCKLFLKNAFWIADYRDLWTKNALYNPPITKKYIDPVLESKFHKYANLIILNTKWDLKLHQNLFPFIIDKSIFIRNGFNKLLNNSFSNKYKFIYAGGTQKGKATISIIELLEKINMAGVSAICDFYGEYDKNMENSTFIKYCGSIESNKVPELLTQYKFGFIYLPKDCQEGGRVAQKFYDYIGSGVIPICYNASIEMKGMMNELKTGIGINDNTLTDEIIEFIHNTTFNAKRAQREKYTRDSQFEVLIDEIEKRGFF